MTTEKQINEATVTMRDSRPCWVCRQPIPAGEIAYKLIGGFRSRHTTCARKPYTGDKYGDHRPEHTGGARANGRVIRDPRGL
jgi:hypothetical protein